MPTPTRAEVLRQLDILRGGIRLAETTIRKMKLGQPVKNVDGVLRKLAQIRSEAKEVRDAVRK